MRFEWDESKAGLNRTSHDGVTFDEAKIVFSDPLGVLEKDELHSDDESRFALIGLSGRRLLFIVFTMRADVYRIIHARKATATMAKRYDEQNT